MTGYGSTGYCYYENVPQGEMAKTVKQGNFKNDLLEGEIKTKYDVSVRRAFR